jgi:hypothetical protein
MQNKFNLDAIDGVVSTQYNDYRGFVAIDQHGDSRNLFSMCKDHGIDIDQYFLYGMEFYDSEPVGTLGCFRIKVFLIDKATYGQSFNEISQYAGDIELTTKDISVPYSKIGDYIKRVSIGFVDPISRNICVALPEGL